MRYSWVRLKNETAKAFQAFCIYRDMGIERSIEKVSKELGKSMVLIERWSSRYNWGERAKAYDDYIEELKRKQNEKEILEMTKRHIKIALGMQAKIVERLKSLDVEKLSPMTLVKWLETSINIERLSRGVETENKKTTVEGKIEIIPDDKKEVLQDIFKKTVEELKEVVEKKK